MTPDEQRQEIKAIIAFYEARGWDWLCPVAYRASVFVGTWPPPTPGRRKGGRPRKEKRDENNRHQAKRY